MVENNETMVGGLEEEAMNDDELADFIDAYMQDDLDAESMAVEYHFDHLDKKGERVRRINDARKKKQYKRGKAGKTQGVEMRKCDKVYLSRTDPETYIRMLYAGKFVPPIRQYADRDNRVYAKFCKGELGRDARNKGKRDAKHQLDEYYVDRRKNEEETAKFLKEIEACFADEDKYNEFVACIDSCEHGLELGRAWFLPYIAVFDMVRGFFPEVTTLYGQNIDKWDLYNFITKIEKALETNEDENQRAFLIVIKHILSMEIGLKVN